MNTPRLKNDGLASDRVREKMVERLRKQGISHSAVIEALSTVPRHAFIDSALASRAYEDTALPIGLGQTISQPYVVALTAELALEGIADPKQARVLEIGTGCGYAAAVLARIFGLVVSIERLRAIHELARDNLRPLRIANLRLAFGDGNQGVAAEAPFDAIVAAAAGEKVPPAWLEQLKPGGRIVAPLGETEQQLTVIVKGADGRVTRRKVESVKFVPLRGGTA